MPFKDIEKRRTYQREWVRRRREEWLAQNGPCGKCGAVEELEIDHIDPSTKISHRIWFWSQPRLMAELAKCQVLCRACHDQKTAVDADSRAQGHGTESKYHRGCHCEACLTAHNSYTREWKRKKREKDRLARAA